MLDRDTTDDDRGNGSAPPATDGSPPPATDGSPPPATDGSPPPATDGNATNGGDTTGGLGSTDSSSRTIGKDDAFHLLQNSRRRAVLRYLLAHPDRKQFRMRDLAEAVAAWEHDTTVRELSSDQRQRVYIALYQSHLPKLDELDVIDYNQSRGIVEPTALLSVFTSFLETGLHADTQRLTVEDAVAAAVEGQTYRSGVVPRLSSLLSR